MTALVAGLVLLAACSGDPEPPGADGASDSPSAESSATRAERCDSVVDDLLAATQGYVDGYGTTLRDGPADDAGATAAPDAGPDRAGDDEPGSGDDDLRTAFTRAQEDLRDNECNISEFNAALREGLAGITARGAVARGVLLQLEASMTGEVSSEVTETAVAPGEDLARALARLAPGSTVELEPGTYRLRESLVVLQGVTVRGAGRARTRIVSTAPGAAVIALTDARVELNGLAVEHRGDEPASVLIGGPSSSLVLTDALIMGASAEGVDGGSGVLMSAQAGEVGNRGTTLEVTGTRFEGNAVAGVLLTGGHRASIVGSEFVGNGRCGVCFTGASSGALRGSNLVRNAAGVAVTDSARPLVTGSTFQGGQVGVQAGDRAAPVVRGVTVSGARRAALIFTDRARGRVDGSTCRESEYGIVVAPKALPLLGDNACTVVRSR